MSFFDFFGGQECPTAKLADGRLVLSLPDAQTPVIWVMDLKDASTSVLRLETDRQGLFIIRRHSGKAAAEAVAVYRDAKQAARAMKVAARGLSNAQCTLKGADGKPVIIRPASKLARAFNIFLFIWFVAHISGVETRFVQWLVSDTAQVAAAQSQIMLPPTMQQALPASPAQAPAPTEEQSGQVKVGVPMSADDVLGKR